MSRDRIITIYLKGRWAPGDKDWDRGIQEVSSASKVVLADNEYGLNRRSYPVENITRIDHTGHW